MSEGVEGAMHNGRHNAWRDSLEEWRARVAALAAERTPAEVAADDQSKAEGAAAREEALERWKSAEALKNDEALANLTPGEVAQAEQEEALERDLDEYVYDRSRTWDLDLSDEAIAASVAEFAWLADAPPAVSFDSLAEFQAYMSLEAEAIAGVEISDEDIRAVLGKPPREEASTAAGLAGMGYAAPAAGATTAPPATARHRAEGPEDGPGLER